MALDATTAIALLLSLAVLAKASEFLIKYAAEIALLAGISEMAVGFLLLAVSTSFPELLISVTSALSGSTELAIGNVFGANIANATWVIAAAVLFGGISIPRRQHGQLAKILLAVTAISIALILAGLSRAMGVVLLACFAAYAYSVLGRKIEFEKQPAGRVPRKKARRALREMAASVSALFKSLLLFAASAAVVVVSAQFAVGYAVQFAHAAGLGLALVGATIVSIGTTLPELSVSIAGARAGKGGLVLGNAIGSCITNLALVLGLSAVINPAAANLAPHLGMVAYSLLVYAILFLFIDYRRRLGKAEAVVLLAAYALFLLAQLNVVNL